MELSWAPYSAQTCTFYDSAQTKLNKIGYGWPGPATIGANPLQNLQGPAMRRIAYRL